MDEESAEEVVYDNTADQLDLGVRYEAEAILGTEMSEAGRIEIEKLIKLVKKPEYAIGFLQLIRDTWLHVWAKQECPIRCDPKLPANRTAFRLMYRALNSEVPEYLLEKEQAIENVSPIQVVAA